MFQDHRLTQHLVMRILLLTLVATTSIQAFSPIGASRRLSTSIDVVTRDDFLQTVGVIAASALFAPVAWADETLPSGVTYTIIKKGDGPQPVIGELAAIRFNAFNGETKIDDIFDTPEPLYTRVGSGGMLKVSTHAKV